MKAYTDQQQTTVTCEAKLSAQEVEGIDLSNVGGAMERRIDLQADVEGIEYEISGPCVEEPEIRTDGVLAGQMLIEKVFTNRCPGPVLAQEARPRYDLIELVVGRPRMEAVPPPGS